MGKTRGSTSTRTARPSKGGRGGCSTGSMRPTSCSRCAPRPTTGGSEVTSSPARAKGADWGGALITQEICDAKWVADLSARNYDGTDDVRLVVLQPGLHRTEQRLGRSVRRRGAALLRRRRDGGQRHVAMGQGVAAGTAGGRAADAPGARRPGAAPASARPARRRAEGPTIAALLKALAQRNAGLCVVTSRERVRDLAALRNPRSLAGSWSACRRLPGSSCLNPSGCMGRRAIS